MAIIHVDGKEYEVNGADNLLQACLSLGLDIPYFCWHPALGSVGSCRQCAVKQYKDADDKVGRLVMSCMTPATDGTWISIADDEAKKFRENVIEWLMTNHPHDCPVCEEGGHCHLQDMTVMSGHSKRRYRFEKRTHNNQYLGPFINHEMNRCIACYRCVRFYNDYADGTDLGVYGAHNYVYFGRVEDGCLESEFSGNLTEICPTGVFTDKTHSERYNRKWDMQFAPSICYGCSMGCNISAGERYGELRRIENRYHGEVNRYFLCDRGRFGYGFVNRKDRPLQPVLVKEQKVLTIDQALDKAADLLKNQKVIGIGSPRASLESNFALSQLVGKDNFSTGIAANELECINLAIKIMQDGPLPTPTVTEVEQHDAVFILGEDLTQTAARLALAVRQAVKGKAIDMAHQYEQYGVQPWLAAAVKNIAQQAKNPLFIANVANTRLDDVAAATIHGTPVELVQLACAIAHELDNTAPAVSGLSNALQEQAKQIAEALANAKKPLLISGCSLVSKALLEATANIANALKLKQKEAALSLVFPEANSVGLALLANKTLEDSFTAITENKADVVVILENDLYRRASNKTVDTVLATAKSVIVVDHQVTATTAKADLLLSAASFAEADGTLVSQEGRAQRFFQVFDPTYYDASNCVKESWRWLHAIHSTLESKSIDWTQLDHVTYACADANTLLAGIKDAAPDASFRIKGLKLAREPHRYSGRTSMLANKNVHEPRTPQDIDTAFAFSMEGYAGTSPERQQIPFAWTPGWNSPQAWNKFQAEVGGHLRAGDPGIRLLANKGELLPWFTATTDLTEGLYVVPLYHLFGSEEMSAKAAPIQERIVEPYIALNTTDATHLNVQENEQVKLTINGQQIALTVRLNTGLERGLVGLPAGFANIPTQLFGQRISSLQELQEKAQ
ncbi:NADH-quinone oxidoreductase subunit NuoG [Entomomonas asaccharolytica]|uniref:NADH-quinone oxidoreductase n=1 Tax=Entomomonas asaccharolytica TaxID=2785331 RepID=A0A974NDC1_9GAMM|nr:NADH-quinone oxidoreductase subunit NuoG [Entomomonas asaccharolytica]QQP84332.1 NADH-quinone oxidoreductase subunit NuoG [Entomomonas asaccharolytica]